jgi:hypothetical protein
MPVWNTACGRKESGVLRFELTLAENRGDIDDAPVVSRKTTYQALDRRHTTTDKQDLALHRVFNRLLVNVKGAFPRNLGFPTS